MKYLDCHKAGIDCKFVASGTTPEEVLKHEWEHLHSVHPEEAKRIDHSEFAPHLINTLRHSIREE